MTTSIHPLRDASVPPDASTPEWEGREGCITGSDAEGRVLVDFEGNPTGPRAAISTVPLRGALLEKAITARQRVELRFHDGDVRRPVIVGIGREASNDSRVREMLAAGGTSLELHEDSDGVTLRVGKASLRLMHDGKIFLKGTYVETNAEGLNRIKGGTVDIG